MKVDGALKVDVAGRISKKGCIPFYPPLFYIPYDVMCLQVIMPMFIDSESYTCTLVDYSLCW